MRPYYADDSVTLYHGDCRELAPPVIAALTGAAADLIVADPPYAETCLAWDTWPDGWPTLATAAVPAMWCFGSMRMFLDRRDEFAGWRYSQEVIWEKHNGSSMAADRFSRVHEIATFWYRGKWADIHHQTPVTHDATARVVRRRKQKTAQWQGARGATTYAAEDGGPRLMRSVIYCRSMHGRALHPTEKPLGILEPLIEYGCPPGGLVVDLFAGSGAALEAARLTGRRAIGFELDERYCEIAANRLTQGALDLTGGA